LRKSSSKTETGMAGARCITGPIAKFAFTLSTACWASRSCSISTSRRRGLEWHLHGATSGRVASDPTVGSAVPTAGRETPQPRRDGSCPNRASRSKPWQKLWASISCRLPHVGNTGYPP
jgi:hypothetical protein